MNHELDGKPRSFLYSEIERLREENSALLDDFENVQEDRNALGKENEKLRSIINGIEDRKALVQLVTEFSNAVSKFPRQTYLEKQLIQRALDITE
jgi:FtsZ-binding cell division protein ZapB